MAKTKTQKQTKTLTKKQAAKGRRKLALMGGSTDANGYIIIGRAPNWDMKKYPYIEGVRGETHEITMDRGKASERIVRNFILQEIELGPITVWESSWLKSFFDQTEDGDEVFIEFIGLGTAKKGQMPPKQFNCGVKK